LRNKITITIAFLWISFCAGNRDQVTDQDLERVLEKWGRDRIASAISVKEGDALATDRELFLEACKLYRLDPDLAMQLLKAKNVKLFQLIQGEN
jgi:hypothetical protein